MSVLKKKKTALVLGGGSARGLAHIGVFKILRKEGIEFDFIVGTSIGSLLGASYGLGISIEEMERRALKFSTRDLVDIGIPRLGLSEGNKLEKIITAAVGKNGFEDMQCPIYIVTTDIEKGEEVVFESGDLIKSIKASCALPGIFSPVIIGDRMLIDGGIVNSVPVSVAYGLGADYVVAVDVGFCVRRGDKITNMVQIIVQSIQIMGNELNKHQARQADLVIKPKLHNVDQLAFNQAESIINAGEDAALKKIHQIKRHMKHKYKIF